MIAVEATGQGGLRYRLLETMRNYARARLAETGETDTLRAAHAAYYLALAGLSAQGQPAGLAAPTVGFQEEEGNMREALEWSRQVPPPD